MSRWGTLGVVALAALAVLAAGCAPAAKTTGLARSMGWVPQQSGTGSDLTGVCFTSVGDGWAIGEAGTLLATSDGGAHWHSVDCGTGEDLFSVTFADRSHGWLLGDDEVIRTSDAGRHWSVVRLGSWLGLSELVFTDRLHGIVAGVAWHGSRAMGIIFCTSDAGAHWHVTWEQDPRFHFTPSEVLVGGHTIAPYAIAVPDRRHIVVWGGAAFVLSSSDGGCHWSLSRNKASTGLLSPVFPTRSQGWAVDAGGQLLASRDGGRTWRRHHADLRMSARVSLQG